MRANKNLSYKNTMNFNNDFKKEGSWIGEYSAGGTCQAMWKILDRKARDGKFRVVSSAQYRKMQRASSDKIADGIYHNHSMFIPENIVS